MTNNQFISSLGIISNLNQEHAAFQATSTYESGALQYEDFPKTSEPVHILGHTYSALYDIAELRKDILTRLWFTYRKGFSPIGGTGPQTDTGWGCMLRCGQMMLAHALLLNHLGRGWRWNHGKQDAAYRKILSQFQDKKNGVYSIHQIAAMGVSEGKSVGQWFGPNTIAHVLKKLVVYDEWSNLAVHVAMDNTIILEDIRQMCRSCPDDASIKVKLRTETGSEIQSVNQKHCTLSHPLEIPEETRSVNILEAGQSCDKNGAERWRPLLLIIPLRLGLSELNPVYIEKLKKCFCLEQSAGIIGGKPNHAHWFIGYVANELVYLDPHTTQPVIDLNSTENTDDSFHCPYASRMKFEDLDPSMGLGFFCKSESEFDGLCHKLRKEVLEKTKSPLFEIHEHHPAHWPPFQPYPSQSGTNTEFTLVERQGDDTDEDFVLV